MTEKVNSNALLITGVAGFIGRHVARHFAGIGWRVVGVDTAPPENAPLASLSTYRSIALPDPGFDLLIEQTKPLLCVHCAGRASVNMSITAPTSDFASGPVLTFEILNSLRLHAPQCRFVFLSSAAVYGNPRTLPVSEEHHLAPISPYGFHKWQGEILCQEFTQVYGLPTASVRLFSAYGPGLRRQVIWDICHKALILKGVELRGTGGESRDFVHAADIARAIEVIAEAAPMTGETYNVASGEDRTIGNLATMICEILDIALIPQFDGVVPSGDPLNWRADLSKIRSLGFTPKVPFEHGLRSMVAWCRAELTGL